MTGMDLMLSFEMLDENLCPDVFQEDMMSFWGGSYAF